MKGKMRVLAMALSLVMVSSMFAACNNAPADDTSSNTPSTASGTESQTEEEYSPKMAEPTRLTWYMWDKQPTRSDLIEKANAMSMEDINVEVNFKWTAGVQETVQTLLASGASDIDMVFCCSWYANFVGSATAGYFRDITEDFETYAPDLAEFLPERLVEGVKMSGKLYGVPIWKDSAGTNYWYCRTDILEAADAMEEFKQCGDSVESTRPVLEKIKAWHDSDPENNLYSEGCTAPWNFEHRGYMGNALGWTIINNQAGLGIRIGSDDYKVIPMMDDEKMRADYRSLQAFANEGLTNGKEAAQIQQEMTLQVFNVAQGWDGAQYDTWGGPKKGYSTSIQKQRGPFMTSETCQAAMTCIGVNSPNVEAALKYIQYINVDEEFRNFMRYGEEGVDWEEVDGRAKILQNDTWMLQNFAIGSLYNLMVPLNVDDEGNAVEEQASVDMNRNICNDVINAEADDLLGLTVDTSEVQNTIAAIGSVLTERMTPLNCGTVEGDVDAYVDSVLEELYDMGLQEVIDECQRQVDEFLASK